MRLLVGLVVCLGLGVAAGPAAADGPQHPLPLTDRSTVPLGAALWYGCADPAYHGSTYLACQVAPPAGSTAADAAQAYGAAFSQSFDRLTPENEFKMLWTEPRQGQFDFSTGDDLTAFARARGMHVRGHTLAYAAASPGWVTNPRTPWTRDGLLTALTTHITTEVAHFRTAFPGVVDEWDVVNEPFVATGGRDPNVFERVIGSDWIEQAFRAANAADPDALLYLNEFDADVTGAKQQALLAVARDFVTRGVPIDGIGLQMHLGADGRYPTKDDLAAVMSQYAALGLRVAITELDVLRPAQDDGGGAQRAAYDAAAEACREAVNCISTTVWGVGDRYSWRGPDQHADLLGADFTPKAAYADVRCRLGDPRPLSGVWIPRACDGAAPSSSPLPSIPAPLPVPAPVPVAAPVPAPAATTATTAAPPSAPPAPRPASARLRLSSARRSTTAVRVAGTTVAQGQLTVEFGQVVRGRVLRRTASVPIRSGRFAAGLHLRGDLARVRRGTLRVRYSGSAAHRPATAIRTLRRPR